MKVYLANYEPNKIGGGWTFSDYISRIFNTPYEEAKVYFIAGATLASYDQVAQAKKDGKKIVLRVDNHLLPSRNRNTGMSRLREFADTADLIIFQSKWAKRYLGNILGVDGAVILNGTDLQVFNNKNRIDNEDSLYVRSSRIAEKGFERARYWFSRNHNNDNLNIVGKFSSDNFEYKFDFFNNEKYKFKGELNRFELANEMRTNKYFLYSYFMDACSNTLIEARASGMKIVDVYGDLKTGGAPEIMKCNDLSIDRMFREYKEAINGII